jgi:hypothetical protein
MLISFFTYFHLLASANSAPVDNQWLPPLKDVTAMKTERAPNWVPQPTYRRTWGILESCIFALAMCVYTVVSLNLPKPHERKIPVYLRKLKWMCIALVAPEVVIYTVWQQWYQTRKLREILVSDIVF